MARLLAEDVRTSMPPYPEWFSGRETVLEALAASWNPDDPRHVGAFRMVMTGANGQPSAAAYVRAPGSPVFRPFAIGVLRVACGRIAEITAFHEPALFERFGLPARLHR
jgi:RNA polymerase sigma-70 factor, ECF subfamily